ncbi:hypothetical protein BDZ94DRAFT_1285657 [Collybia nuda]|uniref:Mediator complex subunit 27 n=1 Tax=Collybia nuda TaxID=64659 RepID=A0A9P5XTU9_9AGAR|nr:hypothetical protein BDZ94DRAFT_1285657 [Collybia nuda]
MQTEESPHTSLTALQAHLHVLSDLYYRIPALRHIPPVLLKPSPISPTLREEFHKLRDVGDIIRSHPIQEALRVARDSLNLDSSQLNSNPRRENRKRRRLPSPDSPQPYVGIQRRSTSLFPPLEDDHDPLTKEALAEYVCQWNQDHKIAKTHLWRRTRDQEDGQLTTLRFIIPDVLMVYVTLALSTANAALVVETVTAFAPREKKFPHSQSDYIVYQTLSQQLARMVQSYPSVSVQSMLGVLCAYKGLFVDRCTVCERVLSTEGHIPPVVRIWREGQWWARHVGC